MKLIVDGTKWTIGWGITKEDIQFAVVYYDGEVSEQYIGGLCLTQAVLHIAATSNHAVASHLKKA